MRWTGVGLVLVFPLVQGCSEGCSRRAPGERTAPEASVEIKPDAAVDDGPGNHFVWNIQVSNPAHETTNMPLSAQDGPVPIGLDRWKCDYKINPGIGTRASRREETAWVSCWLGNTGAKAETTVFCKETGKKPSECGRGKLRVSDAAGRTSQLEMSCKSASSNCAPQSTEPATPASAPSGTASARAAPSALPDAGAGGGRARDADGALHFQWKFELVGAVTEAPAVSPLGDTGEIATAFPGWTCSYAIGQQQNDPVYPQLEVGHVSCRSKKSGERAEGVLACAENRERPSACNVSSFSMTDESGQMRKILMRCKGATSRCW